MFSSVVVGTDGSSTAAAAVQEAINLAAKVSARLLIVSAYEPVSELRLRVEPELRHGTRRTLAGVPLPISAGSFTTAQAMATSSFSLRPSSSPTLRGTPSSPMLTAPPGQ